MKQRWEIKYFRAKNLWNGKSYVKNDKR